VEVGNEDGGESAQASPMSVNSALGVWEEEQGAMEVESSNVESSKPDVEMVRPSTATATTTTATTTTIATPVAEFYSFPRQEWRSKRLSRDL
jgi:hypothetical protein